MTVMEAPICTSRQLNRTCDCLHAYAICFVRWAIQITLSSLAGKVAGMTLRDKPTFDPYSIGEFSVQDALRSALLSWKKHKLAFLGLAALATVPTIITVWLQMSVWSYLASGFTITFLVAVISHGGAPRTRTFR